MPNVCSGSCCSNSMCCGIWLSVLTNVRCDNEAMGLSVTGAVDKLMGVYADGGVADVVDNELLASAQAA
jgi:hypothetical protein